MKYEFNRRTWQLEPKKEDPNMAKSINNLPNRSCYIYILEYPNLKSVGNIHDKELVWYDCRRHTFSESPDEEGILVRNYKMKKRNQYPKFWIYKEYYDI